MSGGTPSVARGRAAWAGAQGLAAAVVLLVQTVWRGAYLAHGYFVQDDFLMLHLGGTRAMSLSYLFENYAGHVFPGGFLVAYAEARLAPLSWSAAWVPVLATQLATGVVAWCLLSRLLGQRWERVPLLTVFCLGPLSLWSTQWWAVAIQFLPVELCAVAAGLSYLVWRQDANPRARLLPVLFLVLALLFQERGLLVALLVAAVALIVSPVRTVRGRLVAVLREDRLIWAAMVVLAVGYVVLHVVLAEVPSNAGGEPRQPIGLVANFLFRNVVPGLAGGPWSGADLPGAAVVPAGWVVGLSCALVVALVVYTVRYGGTTARVGWLSLVVYLLADALLILLGRAMFGSVAGLTMRYAADTVPMLVVALAGAVRDVRAPSFVRSIGSDRLGRHRAMVASVVVALIYAGSSAVTTVHLAPDFFNGDAKSYVANLRAGLMRQPDSVLVNSPVPSDVLFPWFFAQDRVSTVVGIAPWAPPFDAPSEQLRMVDGAGHVRPIVLDDPVTSPAGPVPKCGYAVTSATPAVVPMNGQVSYAGNVIAIGYYTNVDGSALVDAGGLVQTVPIESGLHVVYVPVLGTFGSVSVQLTMPGTVCLASLDAGLPRAAP